MTAPVPSDSNALVPVSQAPAPVPAPAPTPAQEQTPPPDQQQAQTPQTQAVTAVQVLINITITAGQSADNDPAHQQQLEGLAAAGDSFCKTPDMNNTITFADVLLKFLAYLKERIEQRQQQQRQRQPAPRRPRQPARRQDTSRGGRSQEGTRTTGRRDRGNDVQVVIKVNFGGPSQPSGPPIDYDPLKESLEYLGGAQHILNVAEAKAEQTREAADEAWGDTSQAKRDEVMQKEASLSWGSDDLFHASNNVLEMEQRQRQGNQIIVQGNKTIIQQPPSNEQVQEARARVDKIVADRAALRAELGPYRSAIEAETTAQLAKREAQWAQGDVKFATERVQKVMAYQAKNAANVIDGEVVPDPGLANEQAQRTGQQHTAKPGKGSPAPQTPPAAPASAPSGPKGSTHPPGPTGPPTPTNPAPRAKPQGRPGSVAA